MIKYLIEKGCPFTGSDIMNVIIKYDKISFLKYFLDKYKMTIDKDRFKNIIRKDGIKCLKFVYKNYSHLFDLYFNNNIYVIARRNCHK